MPSTCCPMYASTRLLFTGAVLYRRVSRHAKSSAYEYAAPTSNLPWCNFGAMRSLTFLPANSVTLHQGRHNHGDYCTTYREERTSKLSRPGSTERRTTPFSHLHEAV